MVTRLSKTRVLHAATDDEGPEFLISTQNRLNTKNLSSTSDFESGIVFLACFYTSPMLSVSNRYFGTPV